MLLSLVKASLFFKNCFSGCCCYFGRSVCMEDDARMLTLHTARNQCGFASFVLPHYKNKAIRVLITDYRIHVSFYSIFNTLDPCVWSPAAVFSKAAGRRDFLNPFWICCYLLDRRRRKARICYDLGEQLLPGGNLLTLTQWHAYIMSIPVFLGNLLLTFAVCWGKSMVQRIAVVFPLNRRLFLL